MVKVGPLGIPYHLKWEQPVYRVIVLRCTVFLQRFLYRDISKKPAIFHSQFSEQPLNRL